MRSRVNALLGFAAGLVLQASLPSVAPAEDGAETTRQAGEDQWVPSLAILGGVTIQNQDGYALSELFEEGDPDPVAVQPACDTATDPTCAPVPVTGDDLVISPFVGFALELMTPALTLPWRPRFFVTGEILPTFASTRALAVDGDPDCVRGPQPGSPCAVDQAAPIRDGWGEASANGQGIRTRAEIDTLVYGAGLGVALPLQLGERQLRLRPSFGWLSYRVHAKGEVVNAACDPTSRCTDVRSQFGFILPGFLREPEKLSASDSSRFNGIGPGVDLEVDTGRFGPIGSSLFLGFRAYYILGNRKMDFGATQAFNDQIGNDVENARFQVEVDPWMFRTHVGIRFQWLGSAGGSE